MDIEAFEIRKNPHCHFKGILRNVEKRHSLSGGLPLEYINLKSKDRNFYGVKKLVKVFYEVLKIG